MEQVRQEIQCWRAPAVTRGSLAEAREVLVQEGVGRHGSRLAEVLAKAGSGDADAAYLLASEARRYRLDDDEARGWLWVAACGGHADAASELAELLSSVASSAHGESEARALRELSGDWHRVAARSRGRAPYRDMRPPADAPEPAAASAGVADADGAPGRPRTAAKARGPVSATLAVPAVAVPEEPEADAFAPPGAVAVGPIGDPTSKEGQELTRRFGSVADRRLPYAGRLPAPMEAYEAIVAEYPWAEAAARDVEGHFAVARLAAAGAARQGLAPRPVTLPNLLFVGGPGAGKSTMARLICRIAGLPATVLPCGGVSDAAGIAPVTRSWSTTRPGAIVQAMARHHCPNPALVFEELDKTTVAGSQNGSVSASLLSMVGAGTFHDASLMADVDVTAVSFLATANSLSAIDRPLADRFTVVHVPSPGVEHLPAIHRVARRLYCEATGIAPEDLPEPNARERELLRKAFLRGGRSARAYGDMLARVAKQAVFERERLAAERLSAISDPVARFAAMDAPVGLPN